MARTPKRTGVTPMKKTATPAIQTASPAKTALKTPAKTPARTPRGKQQSPQKTPMSTRKRKVETTEVAVEVEEIVNKKAKAKGGKALPPKKVEPEIDSEEEEDDELVVNIAAATAGNDSDNDDQDEEESEADDQGEEESEDEDQDVEESKEESEGDEDGEDKKKEEQKASKQSPKSPKAPIKKRPAEELHDTPTVMVRNLNRSVSVVDLKEHFLPCGDIISCKVKNNFKTGKSKALILFKEICDARCAEATRNGKPFQGCSITVNVVKSMYTKENTVVLRNLPKGVKRMVYNGLREAMTKHGKYVHIKFAPNMQSANVLFEDNTSADAALKAGSFDLMGRKVAINVYSEYDIETPETKVILHGIKADTNEDDIIQAVSLPVLSITFPKPKPEKELNNEVVDVIVGLNNEASAKKLIAGKTLKVNHAVVDVLPHYLSKVFCNTETGVYFRHPAAVFAENIPTGLKPSDLTKTFEKYGPIQRIYMKNHWAIIYFEKKADAQKALKAYPQQADASIKLHAVDGTYVPNPIDIPSTSLAVGRTVYFSNIIDSMNIAKLIKNIKGLNQRLTRIIPDLDLLTQRFKHGVFLEFDTDKAAKEILSTAFELNEVPVRLEMYDPSKHDHVFPENMVLVENLDQGTKGVDLWKSFQGFGQIANTGMICSMGYGYVEFSDVDDAKKALNATSVKINGNTVKIVKPSPEIANKIRKKVEGTFKLSMHQQSRGKFEKSPGKTFQNKSPFKKSGFKRGGFKTPRRFSKRF